MKQTTDIEKKKQITEAAKVLFSRFGLSKTSMDDIAAACGVAKPTLYYYYENKEAIFKQVVDEEAQSFIQIIEKELRADLPADRQLEIFYRTLYLNLERYARKMSEVPSIVSSYSPHGQPMVCRIREIFIEKLNHILQAGAAEGSFISTATDGILNTIIEMTAFINLDWMRERSKKSRDQIIDQMINILLNGIRKN